MNHARKNSMKQITKQCYLFTLVAASLAVALLLLVNGRAWGWGVEDGRIANELAGTKSFAPTTDPCTHDKDSWTPFLDIVPSQDGNSVYVSAGEVLQVSGVVTLHLPTHDKDSWTMAFTPTVQSYVATATGFAPGVSENAPLCITSSAGHDTGLTDLQRIHLPASSTETLYSTDGNLALDLVSADTIPYETYIAIVPSFGPPAPPPSAHAFVGSIYSVRAAGALVVTDKPMLLRLHYTAEMLHGLDPHTLAIFAWNAANKRWQNLGGRLFFDQQYLSVSTRRFTTYALMATNVWRDEFDDFNGLDLDAGFENITLGGTIEERALVLANTPGTGMATSAPIHLPPLMQWDAVEFLGVSDSPTATLHVDILSEDGVVLLEDVRSGASLDGIDVSAYGSLRLRVRMGSSVAGMSPELESWWMSWEERPRVFLPVVRVR